MKRKVSSSYVWAGTTLGIAALLALKFVANEESAFAPVVANQQYTSASAGSARAEDLQSSGRGSASLASKVISEEPAVPQLSEYHPPQEEKFAQFKVLQKKVFKSEENLEQESEIIKDPVFLRELGSFLLDTKNFKTEKFEEDQNLAVDMLIEAFQKGDQKVATEVILQVLRDPQVENPKLPMEQRELLAGAKGELLFYASSYSPETFAHIESYLPGSASLGVWKNVQKQQAINVASSLEEKAAFEKK